MDEKVRDGTSSIFRKEIMDKQILKNIMKKKHISMYKLSKLSNTKYNVDQDISFNEDVYKDTEIKGLKNIHVNGTINFDFEDNLIINLKLTGIMMLIDSYTLDLVDYKFSCDIDESIDNKELNLLKVVKNNENILDVSEWKNFLYNILDISSILWQNIVLEVPISYTLEKDHSNIKGEGWELVDEKKEKIDPRLAKLAELLEEGKE